MVEGTPPRDALPPLAQRATPARKGARCGAGAGSPRPHRPHPGHTGRGPLAARSRGRAAGGGTAPDTRLPSQRWQATPPGDGHPPPPWHAAPTGHAGQGDSVGPPHPHTRAHSTWVADPNSPPSGRAVGGGTAPDLRRPSQWWKAPPPGMPFRHPHSEQRRPARAHVARPVLGPHAHTDRTRDTRVAEPRLPAPQDGRPGEGQRLTQDAPHNGGRSSPPGTAPRQPSGTQLPQGIRHGPAPRGEHSPKPGRGDPGPDSPPPGTPDGARDQGKDTQRGTDHVDWPYQRPVPGPREVRTPHHPGGGERTPRERERTHTQRAGGDYQKGNRTELAERTDRVEWRTSERGKGTPERDGPPHAARDTQGGKGETGGHNTRYQPEPPEPAASAAHTRTGHCTRQGRSGALRNAPTPRLGSLRASPRGSHWRQASRTGPAAPAPRATTH